MNPEQEGVYPMNTISAPVASVRGFPVRVPWFLGLLLTWILTSCTSPSPEPPPEPADTDYEGVSDATELAEGTDPLNPEDFAPRRLGWWRFERPDWAGEESQLPLEATGVVRQESSWSGTALEVDGASPVLLRYRSVEADGRANLHLRQGGVRFWFQPHWNSGAGPGEWANLLTVGRVDDPTGGWFALRISPDGTRLQFTADDGDGGTAPTLKLEAPVQLTAGVWYEIVLGYGKHPARNAVYGHVARLYLDGRETVISALNSIPYPPLSTRAVGFAIGSDLDGNHPARGCLDEFETFNHLLGRVNAGERLGWILTAQGVADPPGIELQWRTNPNHPVRLERRGSEAGGWSRLVDGFRGWRYFDTQVVAGAEYRYRITPESGGGLPIEGAAVFRPPTPASRGQILLLVEQGLEAPLAAEINRLRQDLAADGWRPTLHYTPRHDDAEWDNNPAAIRSIKDFIQDAAQADPEATRGIFILGHVPVPYSGINVCPDGHADHRGAWPADGYYGSGANSGWTDNATWNQTYTRTRQRNLPGDGKFDQDGFPRDAQGRRLALFVGRVDFANLPSFLPGRTEIDLLRAYLDKNHACRIGALRFAPRIVNAQWMGAGNSALDLTWRNATLLGRADNAVPVEADFFRGRLSALLANHAAFGYFDALNSLAAAGYPRHTTFDLAQNPAVPSAAMILVDASYLGDFDSPDNLLRALLANPHGGLAAAYAGYVQWDLQALALGHPLGEALVRTVASDTLVSGEHVYTTLLGDPTLRLPMLLRELP